MDFPDYLTDEQKRFWSPENWGNLRLHGEDVGILGVFFDKKKSDDYPVTVIYRDSDGDIIRPYYSVDGKYLNGNERFIEESRPKKTVAWGKDDFIKHRGCLFRKSSERGVIYSSVGLIADDHVQFHYSTLWFYENLPFEYSSDDGVTWLPCTKEVTE